MANLSFFMAIASLALCGYTHAGGPAIQMPPGCEGLTYCTQRPDEHKALVSQMDQVIARSKYWGGLDAGNNHNELTNSIHTDEDNCGYIRKTEEPFIIKANTTSSENKLVVQTELFKQRIETTSCLNKEDSCLDALKAEHGGITTRCDERHATITLYVFDEGKIVPQSFRIPVSCSCIVQYT